MTTGQDPIYTPTPISQRDGSALASSNCRMASIATGIDYDTKGAKRSTGKAMRSYCDDQQGGTDSSDAVQAWSRGYAETLTVRDGYTFDNALQDLAKGSAVHLDVWHAAAGGPCLSGSGAYGHTMFVLPDQHSDGERWRVADPWCSPGSWAWWPESKLRAGAEEWGRRVYGAAVQESDWPTGGRRIGNPRGQLQLLIVRRIVRYLMDRHNPDQPEPDDVPPVPAPTDWETGGGKPILFTRTVALGIANGDTDMPGLALDMTEPWDGTARVHGEGHSYIRVADQEDVGVHDGFTKQVYARATLHDGWGPLPAGTPVVLIGTGLAVLIEADCDLTPADTGGGDDVEEALAERDEDWRQWLLAGSPGQDEDPT